MARSVDAGPNDLIPLPIRLILSALVVKKNSAGGPVTRFTQ